MRGSDLGQIAKHQFTHECSLAESEPHNAKPPSRKELFDTITNKRMNTTNTMMKYIKTSMRGALVIGLCLLSSAPKTRGQEVTLGVFEQGDNEQCPIYGCCEQVCTSLPFSIKVDLSTLMISLYPRYRTAAAREPLGTKRFNSV